MKQKIYTLLGFFIVLTNTIFCAPLQVYASDGLSGFDNWTFTEKMNYWGYNASQIYFGACGFAHGNPVALDLFLESEYDKLLLENCTYEEWICARMGVQQNVESKEYELVLDDELCDLMKKACDKYINEYGGWYEMDTMDYRNYPASGFGSQGAYQAFISYCTQNLKGTDNVIFMYGPGSEYIKNEDGTGYYKYNCQLTSSLENIEFYSWSGGGTNFENDSLKRAYITQNWQTIYLAYYYLYEDGTTEKNVSLTLSYCCFKEYNIPFPLTDGKKTVRVYKTLEDLKNYSVGQRPYYTTSKFKNYDVSGDNSCIIAESKLDGSSVYGDVVNNVITIIENADGLTEDELRRILDEYFDKIKDDDDDSDGGSGSGSGSGSGLGDLLDGLGSIGDVIMSILGKLLEYVGKALDLVGSTVTKVIDIIPQNITNLLGALFPFLPEEWLTAIELSLVLAVVVGIVGIFKK